MPAVPSASGRCAKPISLIVAIGIVGCAGWTVQGCGGDANDGPPVDAGNDERHDAGDPLPADAGSDAHDAPASPCGSIVPTPDAWSKRYGDIQTQYGLGLAVDVTGAAVIGGFYTGPVDFGGGPLPFEGAADGFIAKIDTSGKHVWSRRVAGTGDDRVLSVATDSACNVVVTGFFMGTVDFGGGPLVVSSLPDVFVAKFDASGKHLWSKRFGDGDQQEGHSLAIDAAGNIVVTGMFAGSIDFGGGPIKSAGPYDIFVAKLDPSGNHLWSKTYGNPASRGQDGRSVAVSSGGDVFVTGACAGAIDFGGGPLAAIGDTDAFVLSLDSGGGHRWSKRWGTGNTYQSGSSVTVSPSGEVVVAASAEGAVDIGTGVLPAVAFMDIVVGKFSPAGTPIVARRFGSSANELASSVATDASGNILITGYTSGPLDFGKGPVTDGGPIDRRAFIAKLDPSLVAIWSRGTGIRAVVGSAIAADAKGNVLAAGTFTGSVDFGTGPLTNEGGEFGGEDVFLAKIAP